MALIVFSSGLFCEFDFFRLKIFGFYFLCIYFMLSEEIPEFSLVETCYLKFLLSLWLFLTQNIELSQCFFLRWDVSLNHWLWEHRAGNKTRKIILSRFYFSGNSLFRLYDECHFWSHQCKNGLFSKNGRK